MIPYELGRLISKSIGSSASESLAYDIHNWMTSISASISGSPVFSETLRYSSALKETSAARFDGNISEIRVIHNGVSDDTYAYQYDALKRLTGANRYIGTATTYSDTRTEKYMSYDRDGNLTALKRYGDTGLENNLTFTRSGNRMTGLSDAGSPGGTFTFSYDALGNLTNDGRKGLVFSYNVLNLPSGVATTASGSLTYTYLSDGTKVSAIKSDGTGERYIGSFVYSVPASGSETLESAAWDEGRINFTKSGSTYTKTDLWFVKDHVGNVRTVMNVTTSLSSPQVLERNDYLPFGTRINAGTAVLTTNRFRLGGKENQTFGSLDLGKVDFGARMYDPFTASWTTADPLAAKYGSISPYGYCGGNPIGIFDNGGLDLVIAGKNNSSITLKTNLIDKKFSVASLGIDWKGNYTLEGNDLLSAGLDLVGIADPTGVADLANASLQYKSGDYLSAGLSVIGVIPYAGDLAKAGKIGRDVNILNSAVHGLKAGQEAGAIAYKSFTQSNFRKNLVKMTGKNPDGMDAHHLLPKAFEEQLGLKGINVHDPKYGRWVDHSKHNKTAQRYNKDFKQFLKSNEAVSEKDIINFAESLMSKYDLY